MAAAPRELRLCVTADDYDEALRFYRDILGLAEQATYAADGGRVTILHAGRATLELADPSYAAHIDDVEVGRRVAGPIRVAFEVLDTQAVTERLVGAGATVVAPPVRTPWGSLNARLDGPAGLHLTVFSPEIYLSERPRLSGAIELADPDPEWSATAARLTAAIRSTLGDRARLLEHVGSTSVPDLPAKPLIDLVLAVDDPVDEESYVPALEALGYQLRVREPEWHEHRLLKHADPDVNLHVFGLGVEEIDRMLAFRDHLRADPVDRQRYADAKAELAGRTWEFVQDYADAKSDVVADILSRALDRTPAAPGFFVLVPSAAGAGTLARELAERLRLPLLSAATLAEALGTPLGSDGGQPGGAARDAADGILAVAAETGGAVLLGPWRPGHAAGVGDLPGQVVEVTFPGGQGTGPIAGGGPVLVVDAATPVDHGRLARQVRQLATYGRGGPHAG